MTSPLPPKRRDTRTPWDLLRQDRTNLRQLNNGLMGGRAPMLRPLPGPLADGDDYDDDAGDDDLPAAWNLDQITATTAGQVSLTLTYVPIEGTLLVFWDGEYLHPSEYVLAGQTIVFTDRHIHVDDRLEAAYWYWPSDVPEIEPPAFVGVTLVSGDATTIALPDGTVAGDLMILATCGWTAGDCTDTRMSLNQTLPGQFTPIGKVWVGTADASGNPVAVSIGPSSLRDATVLAVYRNATIVGTPVTASDTDPAAATASAPQVADAVFAVNVALMRTGSFSTGAIGRTGGYVTDGVIVDDDKVNTLISHWAADEAATSPADGFTFGGSVDGWGLVTYRIGGTA